MNVVEGSRPPRSKRQAREESTRARVLDAAEHEFAVEGYEDARIHAIAERAQVVRLAGRSIRFAAGETIHTESSHKYRPERLAQLAAWAVLALALILLEVQNGQKDRTPPG